MAEHKWADVLRAMADGKEVECFIESHWSSGVYCVNPLSHPHLEWRIKPEPKPDVVRYVNAYLWDGHSTLEKAENAQADDIAGRCLLTFDGETGKLKSAEVLP